MGEAPKTSRIVMIGDRIACELLDQALAAAKIPRAAAYLCDAIDRAAITALAPEIVVLLGANAAQALLGSKFRVSKEHGRFLATELAPHTLTTVHPAYVLRARDEASRNTARTMLFADLATVGNLYANHARRVRRAA